jgi:hypothetical protein
MLRIRNCHCLLQTISDFIPMLGSKRYNIEKIEEVNLGALQ